MTRRIHNDGEKARQPKYISPIENGELADAALSREAPEKWTAPFLGIVRDKDDNIVEPEGFPKWTEEQKKVVLENLEYFRSIAPREKD